MRDKKFRFKMAISEKGEVFMSFCDPWKNAHQIESYKVLNSENEVDTHLTVLKHGLVHAKLFQGYDKPVMLKDTIYMKTPSNTLLRIIKKVKNNREIFDTMEDTPRNIPFGPDSILSLCSNFYRSGNESVPVDLIDNN